MYVCYSSSIKLKQRPFQLCVKPKILSWVNSGKESRIVGGNTLGFCPTNTVCGILVPGPEIESVPPTVEAQVLNHWTTREVLGGHFYDLSQVHLYHLVFHNKNTFLCYLCH